MPEALNVQIGVRWILCGSELWGGSRDERLWDGGPLATRVAALPPKRNSRQPKAERFSSVWGVESASEQSRRKVRGGACRWEKHERNC
jgi:hypothetical protein